MVDEFINGTLSKMINRIKKGLLNAGDYRYFLTQLVHLKNHQQNKDPN